MTQSGHRGSDFPRRKLALPSHFVSLNFLLCARDFQQRPLCGLHDGTGLRISVEMRNPSIFLFVISRRLFW
jgi:hypothetical protein